MRRCVLVFILVACGQSPEASPDGGADAGVDGTNVGDGATCSNPYAVAPNTGVRVGAIRWDPWYRGTDMPNVFNPLPELAFEWFDRMPFFTALDAGAWTIASDTQDVADREIDYAVTRGIDFWAFCYNRFLTIDYATGKEAPLSSITNGYQLLNHKLSYSLDLYLASTRCNKPRFSLILDSVLIDNFINVFRPSNVTRDQAWQMFVGDVRGYFENTLTYKTPDGRPVIFVLEAEKWGAMWGGDATLARNQLDALRATVAKDGSGSPWIVAMGVPQDAALAITSFGFDSATVYGWSAGMGTTSSTEVPFAQATAGMSWYDDTVTQSGVDLMPPVTTGWDYRPLAETDPTDRNPLGNWYTHPSPQEIVTELDQAITYVKAHAATSRAQSVLIYAWNELGEGGYLVPRLADGTARLDAIGLSLGRTFPPSVPTVAPVVVPIVTQGGSGCSDGYGVWLDGTGFDADSYVELRSAQAGQNAVVATYTTLTRGSDAGAQSLSFCLTGNAERTLFSSAGLRVSIVDPSRPSISAPFVAHF